VRSWAASSAARETWSQTRTERIGCVSQMEQYTSKYDKVTAEADF
jgi:hypothetical protein